MEHDLLVVEVSVIRFSPCLPVGDVQTTTEPGMRNQGRRVRGEAWNDDQVNDEGGGGRYGDAGDGGGREEI